MNNDLANELMDESSSFLSQYTILLENLQVALIKLIINQQLKKMLL